MMNHRMRPECIYHKITQTNTHTHSKEIYSQNMNIFTTIQFQLVLSRRKKKKKTNDRECGYYSDAEDKGFVHYGRMDNISVH